MKFRALFFLIFLSLSCKNADTDLANFTAKVIGIKDGDTIEVLLNNKPIRIRLADIDCPERSQPFGKAAKQYSSNFCFGKEVKIESSGEMDRYGRLIATVFINNRTLNSALLENGLAWHYKKYSDNDIYAALEIDARNRHVGIWSQPNPIAPWDWRKYKRSRNK